jgi:hypothetical protein
MTYGYDQADRLASAAISTTGASPRLPTPMTGTGCARARPSPRRRARRRRLKPGMPPGTADAAARGRDALHHGARRHTLEQVGPDDKALYYLHDQLGSTRALLDGQGNTWRRSPTAPTATSRHGRAARRHRWLRGRVHRRRDRPAIPPGALLRPSHPAVRERGPARGPDGPAYAYTADDPLNATDPSGL